MDDGSQHAFVLAVDRAALSELRRATIEHAASRATPADIKLAPLP
jgi:hypothetical protein